MATTNEETNKPLIICLFLNLFFDDSATPSNKDTARAMLTGWKVDFIEDFGGDNTVQSAKPDSEVVSFAFEDSSKLRELSAAIKNMQKYHIWKDNNCTCVGLIAGKIAGASHQGSNMGAIRPADA